MSKRRVIAAAAVLGIGAAGTAALWTNDAWVRGSLYMANAADELDLQVAYDATMQDVATPPSTSHPVWKAADDLTNSNSLVAAPEIPAEAFGDILPGIPSTQIVWLRNAGDSPVDIATAISVTGLNGEANWLQVSAPDAPAAMEPGDVVPVTISVQSDPETPMTARGTTGKFEIQFQATLQAADTE